jgi:hypothetical protein
MPTYKFITQRSSDAELKTVEAQISSITGAIDANTSSVNRALNTKANTSDLQNVQNKVPSSLDPILFTPGWAVVGLYTVPPITQGPYPLHGIDHTHTGSLVMPHTAGMSNDWTTEFSNAALDKQYVSNVANSLTYNGSGPWREHSLVTTKEYTVSDGFNFSCKVQLKGEGFNDAIAYNGVVNGTGLSNYSAVNISGTDEVEVVIVKDQNSDNVRVWKGGIEDATVYPAFTGGHLVVLSNSNVTFSEVKLTDTTVDLGISSILKEYTNARVAIIQSAHPITQQNVDDYAKVNVVIRNEAIRFDPTKDYSSSGYVLKVGAAQYYQVSAYDSILLEAELVGRLANVVVGADLVLGGNGTGATFKAATSNLDTPKDKSVTLSLKYYSKEVASLRERLTVTGIGAPTVGFGDLTPVTQDIMIEVTRSSLPDGTPDDVIIATLTQAFSGYSLLQSILAVGFGNRPLQSAPEFINSAPGAVVSQTNPSGDFTAQNIESYKQISNKLSDFDFTLVGDSMTVTNNASFATTDSLRVAMLTDIGTQGAYNLAGMIPEQLTTNTWTLNTLDPDALETVIADPASFPDAATFGAYQLSAVSDKFIAVLNTIPGIAPAGGATYFDGLSYKTFAQTFLLQTATTGKDITINNLNGDYPLDITSLAVGDEQKFRQALAMKESADVAAALNIPADVVSGYVVFGLPPPGDTVPVVWYSVSPTRDANNVWLYTRVLDLKTLSYVDADVRREGDVSIITELATVPSGVKEKYTSEYTIDLDGAGVVNAVDKILWNYIGESGQVYYNYTDVSNPLDKINKVLLSNDGGTTWLTDSQAFGAAWTAATGTYPDGKVNSVSVDTWVEVEARISQLNDKNSTLITPVSLNGLIDVNLQGIIATGNYTGVDITKTGAYPITYGTDSEETLRLLAVGSQQNWWENHRALTDTSKDYDINALVVSDDGQTVAFCRGQYPAPSEGRNTGEQKVFVLTKGETVPTEIILPSVSGFTQEPRPVGYGTARAIQRVKLNNDGTVLLIAEWFDGDLTGDVLVYRKTVTGWSLAAEMDSLDNALDEPNMLLGFATADMSSDGNVVVGGSYGPKGIQVMRWNNSNTYVIEAVDLSSNSIGQQGKDVKISSDGTEIIMPITDGGINKLLLLKKDLTTGEWKDHSTVLFDSPIWSKQLHYVSVDTQRLLIGNNNNLIDMYKIDVAVDGTFSVPVLIRSDLVAANQTLLKCFIVGVANKGKLLIVSNTLADGTIQLEKLLTIGNQFDSTAIYESTIVGTFKLSQFAVGSDPTVITRGSMGQPVSLNSIVYNSNGDATSILTLINVKDSVNYRDVILEYPLLG